MFTFHPYDPQLQKRWTFTKRSPVRLSPGGSRAVTSLSCVLMPLLVLLLAQVVTLGCLSDALAWLIRAPEAVLLSWLLLILPAALGYALTARLWCAWLFSALPALLLALVSYYKTAINGVPLTVGDLTLIGQAGEIAAFALPQLRFPASVIASIAAFFAALVGNLLLDRRLSRRRWPLRLGAVGCLLLCLLPFLLGSAAEMGLRIIRGAETQAERIDAAGVTAGIYCALVSDRAAQQQYALAASELTALALAPSPEPSAAADEPEPEPTPEPIRPTVIFLMSESFFDVTELPNLQMNADPLPTFHRLSRSSGSGKFISNTYSGGTGYVELEVLTGLCSRCLRETDTLTSLPDRVYATLPCITDVFDRQGYRAEFLHSYNSKLYNRAVIYPAFGFDSVRFDDSFPADAPHAGGYLSDLALAEEIIRTWEDRDPAEPLMLFTVSMENHQPYRGGKFDAPSGFEPRSDRLDREELQVMDSLIHGLADADAALERLTDYFAAQDEPVMLVFWGDHLPNLTLPDGATAYEKLGYCSTSVTTDWSPEELETMLSTDYLIWTNYGLPKQDKTLGNTFFGLEVLERLGFPLTDYYLWLQSTPAAVCTMYRPRLFVDRDGAAFASVPEQYAAVMDMYAGCVYDIVYGEGRLFSHYRAG